MKKVSVLILCALVTLLLSSCATLPKKVKDGDTLVIGYIDVKVEGQATTADVDMNGDYISGVEMVIENYKTKKQITVKTDKDGFFYIKNLIPHDTYQIVKVTISKIAGSGLQSTLWVDISSPRSFIAYNNRVVNLGCTYYKFDANWVTWEVNNHYYVKEHFLNLDEDSQWLEKEIFDWRQ